MPTGSDATQSGDWVGSSAGFLVVLLTVIGLGVGGNHPDATGPIEPIRSYFLGDTFRIQAGSYIQAVGVLFVVVFGASLAKRFWLGGKQMLAAVVFGAALVLAGLDLVENALLSVLAFSVARDGDAGAIRALYALRQPIMLDYLYFPYALFAFALAIGTITAGVFPRWYGWLTALVGLLFLTGASQDIFQHDPQGSGLGFLLLIIEALWLLLTSGLLLRRPRTA